MSCIKLLLEVSAVAGAAGSFYYSLHIIPAQQHTDSNVNDASRLQVHQQGEQHADI